MGDYADADDDSNADGVDNAYNDDDNQGDAVSMWMMQLVAEEKAARKKEKISNFDLKSIIGTSIPSLYNNNVWGEEKEKIIKSQNACTIDKEGLIY